jgi:hypothetical protein
MPTVKLQVPGDQSGEFHCKAPNQSGTIYRNIEPGSVIEVDTRDAPIFLSRGYGYAPQTADTP